MLENKQGLLDNVYGMRNFYKPGWHFDIDTNLMVVDSTWQNIKDIKESICQAILKEGIQIQSDVETIKSLNIQCKDFSDD